MGKDKSTSEEFRSPVEWLARYFELGTKKTGRFTTAEMEERQAALFGYAYAVGNGIDSLVVRPGEGPLHDFDAEFRWRTNATDHRLPVSLKRLPPAALNPNETLEGIVKKAALKSTGGDLLLAIHVDRAGHLTTLNIPRKFQIRELCLWGWSQPNHAELFVNSYVLGNKVSRQWRVPFPPPGFRSKD
ncbi:MAG TPA: hypothetical protein VGM73_03825 [Candidatus Didemnitutus sp.]|jgi:hypothetical protein